MDTFSFQNGPAAASSRRHILWLWFALALFLVQSLPYLSYRWVTDESWYAAPAYSLAQGHGLKDIAVGPNDLENHFDARPPGTAVVIAGFFKLFGPGQIAARAGSILAGMLIVVLVWRLTRDLLGWPGAAIATLVVATDNLIVLTSRSARPEALTVMAILLSLLAVKQYARGGLPGWAFLSGLLMALGTMFHITLLGYIVSLGLLVLFFDRENKRMPLRGFLAYGVGYLAGLIPFAAWILRTPLGREGFQQEYLARASHASLLGKFFKEGHRYSDLLGFNMLHGHGLEALPVRLPVPLVFLFASFLLWKHCRRWFYLELLLLVPTVLWLIYTVNKSSRYTALLAPVFAMAIGAAVSATEGRQRLHRLVLAGAVLTIGFQTAANLVLLHSASTANFNKLSDELRAVVPRGEPVYATITFWLTFHDQPFISYERTTPRMAASDYKARYFIYGDRMMMQGDPTDAAFYNTLFSDFDAIAKQGSVAGRIDDPYYGHLVIYRLRD